MDYNTSRKHLIMREYGRNVQEMVAEAVRIEDREERNRAVQSIIQLMGRMYPYLRDLRDFKHKLWDHLVIISDFKLDIDAPHDLPTRETFKVPPKKIPYSTNRIKQRYYGNTVKLMIKQAVEMPEGDERDTFIGLLANHMKKSYLVWNKDSVEDDAIFDDIKTLSEGKLVIPEKIKLTGAKGFATSVSKRKKMKKK